MFKSVAVAAISASMAVPVAADDVCTPGHAPTCNLHLKGTFLVHAVDEKRILVAIDVHDEGVTGDGRVDHLFLITHLEKPTRESEGTVGTLEQGVLTIDSDARHIKLKADGEALRLLPLKDVNWSHYWGYGVAGMRIADLRRATQAEECDHVAGSCWRVDGSRINFPS